MILDSGSRTEFESGAVRDVQTGKGRPSLMPLDVVSNLLDDNILFYIEKFRATRDTEYLYRVLRMFADDAFGDVHTMLLETSIHYEEGAAKYGDDNWRKGLPVGCYLDSAVRHYLKYRRGDQDEPHGRAFAWNIMCLLWEVDFRAEP